MGEVILVGEEHQQGRGVLLVGEEHQQGRGISRSFPPRNDDI